MVEKQKAEKQRKISEQQQFESERLAREEKDTKRREQGRNSIDILGTSQNTFFVMLGGVRPV